MAEAQRRHDLLDVDPEAWAALLARRPDLAGVPHLAEWVKDGRPVIVRRRHPGEDPSLVPVGLPLPPRDGKRRIGLALPPSAVRPRAPLFLAEAIGAAPPAWAVTLADLVDLGRRFDTAPRVFGGLLWQRVTGLAYLSDASDLDLLWPCEGTLAPGLLDGLAALDRRAPMRLDGEILIPDGVNWRELHAAGPDDEVLVKYLDRLALCRASSLRGHRIKYDAASRRQESGIEERRAQLPLSPLRARVATEGGRVREATSPERSELAPLPPAPQAPSPAQGGGQSASRSGTEWRPSRTRHVWSNASAGRPE